MSAPPEELQAALAGRYTIERELGSGGMATVYLAEDLKHDRQVALKVLRPELTAVLGAERFVQEIKTTASLQHPHILPLFDSGEANGFFYYVMPYIEGESLRQRLGREPRLTVEESVAIAADVASALSYAHGIGIVHRDVKPENILFHHGEPMVGDFGIALAVSSAGGKRLTETGWSMGTPAYMSPEQVAGDPDVDARSDVYGLACVVYEMFVGAPPYDGPTPLAIMRNQASDPVPSIRHHRGDVAAQLDSAVRRALAHVPEQRFETVAGFAAALTGASAAQRGTASQSGDALTTIAVLPFLNRSPDPDSAFFADGVTDDIMAQLSKIPALRVISRRSTERYREGDQDVATIAAELGADVILEGTIRRAAERVRVVAELIDVRADQNVWAETYDRDLTDVFAIQSDIALNIATALEKNLTEIERADLITQPTTDLEAYDLYLLGLHHMNKRSDDGIRKGIHHFTEALARDPGFLRAKTAMAEAYSLAGIGYASIPLREAQTKALELAREVIAADDTSAEAHATLALAALTGEFDPAVGLASAQRAVALDPNCVKGHQWSAWCHIAMNDQVAALETYERALALDPMSAPLTTESGWPFSFADMHSEGRKRYLRALEIEPGFGLAQYNVAFTYNDEDPESAISWYERALVSTGGAPFVSADLSIVLFQMGEHDRAAGILAELEAAARAGAPAWVQVAKVEGARGNVDAALDALDRAVESHEPMALWVHHTLHMPHAAVRETKRFRKLLERLGVTEPDLDAERERVRRWLAERDKQ